MYNIKLFLLVLFIFVVTHTIPYSRYDLIERICNTQFRIDIQCQYDFLNPSLELDQCAQDYYKSKLCWSSFGMCNDLEAQNKQVPLTCWLCYVQSPANSVRYQNYQQCMQVSAFQWRLILSLGFLLMLFMMIF